MDIINKKFIEKFNKFKQERNLNDTEIADKLGISISGISLYTTGKRTPSKKFIRELTKLCGLDYEYFDAILSKAEYDELISKKHEKYQKKEVMSTGKTKYKYNVVTIRTEDIEPEVLTKISMIAKTKNKKTMELVNEILNNFVDEYEKSLK